MLRFKLFSASLILILGCVINGQSKDTSSVIPDSLLNCYNNKFTITARPPLTLTLLLELIRKAELDSKNTLNTRIFSASMLHSVIFDGVQKSQDVQADYIIPYRATSKHFYKYKLLVDYLTPGESSLFPSGSLTTPELCFLHKLVSNTVDPRERGDESSTCQQQTSMSQNLEMNEDNHDTISKCPKKLGNVKTRYGPVAIGHIIAAVASQLEKETVTFSRVVNAIDDTQNKSVEYKPNSKNNTNVNSMWVASIAGDLAQVVLNQINIQIIGNDGFWNDSIIPRAYYLKSQYWDMTDADVLGGIDAAIIASNIGSTSGAKLSQIIDMYYSEEAVANNVIVSNRSQIFTELLQKINLEEQVIGTAKLLRALGGPYDVFLTEEQISKLSIEVVQKFKTVAENITKFYENTELVQSTKIKTRLETIVITDETWDDYTSEQIIYALAEATQVSYYGSKLGVINGQSGNWLANITGEVFQLFTDLYSNRNSWPKSSSLGKCFESVLIHYQNELNNCSSLSFFPKTRVILVLAPSARLTDNDFKRSQQAIKSIKNTYPSTNIIYLASDGNRDTFNDLANSYSNDTVLKSSNDANTIIAQVSDKLGNIPANIINFYCNKSQDRLEDYITPNVETFYEIHTEYIRRADIDVKIRGYDYGNVSVCVWVPPAMNNKECFSVVNDEISLNTKEYCKPDSVCYLQLGLKVSDSKLRCRENDCRYPSQVRIDIVTQRTSGSISLQNYSTVLFIFSYFLFVLI